MIRFKFLLIATPMLLSSIAYSQQTLKVRIWNYTGVSSEVLRQAEAEVDILFSYLGGYGSNG